MSDDWGTIRHAARIRAYMRQVALSILEEERPDPKFAVVVELESATMRGRCRVIYFNDNDPVAVKTYGIKPTVIGQRVLIDGPRRMRYVTQVMDEPPGLGDDNT